jgi:hypothetical protein
MANWRALGAGVATLVCTACVAGNPVKIGLEARVRWFPDQRVALTSPAFGFTEIGRQERTVESSLLFRVGVPFGL